MGLTGADEAHHDVFITLSQVGVGVGGGGEAGGGATLLSHSHEGRR